MAEGKPETLMVERTKVLLIENQPLTRIGIRSVLGRENDLRLNDESDNAAGGCIKLRTLKREGVLLGLRLPESCSIDDLDNHCIGDPKAKSIDPAEHAGAAENTRALREGA